MGTSGGRTDGGLVVLPSLRARVAGPARVRLTRKFVEGMERYTTTWPGPVRAVLHPDPAERSGNLDDLEVDPRELPFGVSVVDFRRPELLTAIEGATLVQGGADHLLNHLPAHCRRVDVPYVFVSEYTLATRRQIIAAETASSLLRVRRSLWAWNQERANRRNVLLSAGVQCNGTPTHDAYAPLNPNTLLYFDSRIARDMLAERPAVASRIEALRRGEPLRLAFSGRLNEMKGAEHLIDVAAALRDLGVSFTLDICGDGPLAPALAERTRALGLGDVVRLRGVLEFSTELVPFVRDSVDLFVCCHLQGDPSCTYLETLALGVPIAGYANEAFAGLMRHCPGGWTTPVGEPRLLAERIAALAREPEALAPAAVAGLAFAAEHTAERTFAARVAHMVSTADRAAAGFADA